ncbi:MAG: hypothetical protein HPY69_15905 [Armatimonadetes bacterium]|nr:hypothetical protein [Armatimonadota bacterium]
MSDTKQRILAARDRLDAVIREICGACHDSCCHQGTMMGVQGLRRLARGLTLEPDLATRLREGLAARTLELRHDLRVAEKVLDLLRASSLGAEAQDALPELQRRVDDLRRFVEYMETEFPLDVQGMTPLLHYSAIRHNLLRSLRRFPGAEAALSTLSRGQGSFAFRGRKLAPPRCIFHQDRCLAESWKPIKCASFFCTNEPNLLAHCRQAMSFDEFVLAAVRVVSTDFVRKLLALDTRLGSDYWEPKVIIGPEAGAVEFHEDLVALLTETRPRVKTQREEGRFMKSTNEVLADVRRLGAGETLVYVCQSVDGAALYELAVAMDRARGQDWHGGLVLLAQQLSEHSFLAHPLWEDQMISQPLGGLEVYFCE